MASILAVAEVFEGMTAGLPGGPCLTPEEAIQALRTGRGTLYDTECVEALAASVRTPRRAAVALSTIPEYQGIPIETPKRSH